MDFQLYNEVILQRDVPEEGLFAGDVASWLNAMTWLELKPATASSFSICSAIPCLLPLCQPARCGRQPMLIGRPCVRSWWQLEAISRRLGSMQAVSKINCSAGSL